jgi:hypothetical protein
MKVQAFIPNWKAPTCDAVEVYSRLITHCPAEILHGYSLPFREQWEEALSKFTGDILLWAMADCRPENWARAYPAMLKLMAREDVAIWAPNLNQPTQLAGREVRPDSEPGVFETATSNMICFAVKRALLEKIPPVEMHRNGWMYDYLMTAVARDNGMKVLVDGRFEARHTPGSIYDTRRAEFEAMLWTANLPSPWKARVLDLWKKAQ